MHNHRQKRILAVFMAILAAVGTVSQALAREPEAPKERAMLSLVDHGLSLDLRQEEDPDSGEMHWAQEGYAWEFIRRDMTPALALTPARLPVAADGENEPTLDATAPRLLRDMGCEILDGSFSADEAIFDPQSPVYTRQMLRAELELGRGWLEDNGFAAEGFAYPRGYDPAVRELAAERCSFAVAGSEDERPWNTGAEDPMALKELVLRRDNLDAVLAAMTEVTAQGGWLIIGLSAEDKPAVEAVSALLDAVARYTERGAAELVTLGETVGQRYAAAAVKMPTAMRLPGSGFVPLSDALTGWETNVTPSAGVNLGWSTSTGYRYTLTAANYRWVCVDKNGMATDDEGFDGTVVSAGYQRIGAGTWTGGGEYDNTNVNATVSVENSTGNAVQFKIQLAHSEGSGVTVGDIAASCKGEGVSYDASTQILTVPAGTTGNLALTAACTGTPTGDETTALCSLQIELVEGSAA